MSEAAAKLASAEGRGAAFIAHRNLEAVVQNWYPDSVQMKMEEVLESIGFDSDTIRSPLWAAVRTLDGGKIEIFRDWIILAQEAHDVDASTRGQVYVDGSVQVTSTAVPHGKKGKTRLVNTTHDLREAHLQFTSATWSVGVSINLEDVNDARRLVDQLSAHVETLKPQAVSSADIAMMVESILNNTGQPPAEKLTALSNLRYDRLLSDEEFHRAKAKILGIA